MDRMPSDAKPGQGFSTLFTQQPHWRPTELSKIQLYFATIEKSDDFIDVQPVLSEHAGITHPVMGKQSNFF